MNEDLQEALSILYREIIVFFSHTVFVPRDPRTSNQARLANSKFVSDISKVITNIGMYSGHVDAAAAMSGLRKQHNHRAVARRRRKVALRRAGLNTQNPSCIMMPFGPNVQFSGRHEELATLRDLLDPDEGSELRVLGIHGMPGIGKSQLAIEYANSFRRKYHLIAWIPAHDRAALEKGFSKLARKLEIVEDPDHRPEENASKVHSWLLDTHSIFLFIFDGLRPGVKLDTVWPTSNKGSIIITTRSPYQASKWALNTLSVECLPIGESLIMIQERADMNAVRPDEIAALNELGEVIGGLTFGLNAICDFIRGSRCTYREFLRMYHDTAMDIFHYLPRPIAYDYTLTSMFESCLLGLSSDGKTLLKLLVYFQPGYIPEKILRDTTVTLSSPEYDFLKEDLG